MDFVHLLAICHHLDPDVNLETILKLTPYGGLLGANNSLLDTYLKFNKFLQLPAIIHEASGFFPEHSQICPEYSYVLHCPIIYSYIGHGTALKNCLIEKIFKVNMFNLLDC